MTVLYTLRAGEPTEHRATGTIELSDLEGPRVDLVLPSWVPGSYHLVNYVRGFRGMSARAAPGGTPLRVDRVDRARWRVTLDGARSVRLEYSVYGHEMVTEAFDLTPEHLFVNAGLCLPYVDGHREEPVELSLDVPADWQAVTELEEVGGRPYRFRAPSYDVLLDSPIDVGHPTVLTIRPHGIPHRIVLCGAGGNYEAHRLEEDLGRVVETTIRMVGDSPLSRYTFFLHLNDVPDGGLEHATSTSCVFTRTAFWPPKSYRRVLSVTSHEYFHLYNVKRILPKALQRPDLSREALTRLLWWMEGGTDYFGDLVLVRSGLLTPKQYLDGRAEYAKRLLERPGRHHLGLEEASILSWVDYYQPFEETPNQSVDYYLKGHLVCLCLDLEIRHRTENRASLETALRALWS